MRQLYIYILLIPFSIFPQSIVLELDTNILRIGEQFNATIKCYNLDEDVILWEEVDSIFKNFELQNPNWEVESAKIFVRKKRLGVKHSNNLEKDLAKMARAGFNYNIIKNILEIY